MTDHDAFPQELEIIRQELNQAFASREEELRSVHSKYQAMLREIYLRRHSFILRGMIPGFWTKAMINSSLLSSNITTRDQAALDYLTDIRVSFIEGRNEDEGFVLEFHFRTNPFFTDDILHKEYAFDREDPDCLRRIKGCKIRWRQGQNLTQRRFKKHGDKSKQGSRSVRVEQCDSFFNFFEARDLGQLAISHTESAALSQLQELLQADYEVGEFIKDELVPHAIDWFLAVADDSKWQQQDDFDCEDSGEWSPREEMDVQSQGSSQSERSSRHDIRDISSELEDTRIAELNQPNQFK
mmetsp:Transcript_2481/g.4294  ORF Transcript_2481/g.4294 Transcript_2481/m.4294 type:complete len:297 (-) Transcript_2481:80-970(-)